MILTLLFFQTDIRESDLQHKLNFSTLTNFSKKYSQNILKPIQREQVSKIK